MQSSFVLLLSFALLVTAIPFEKRVATRIPLVKKTGFVADDGSVKIEELQRHLADLQAKYARGLAAFERNTGTPHPNAKGDVHNTANDKRQTGAVPLTDDKSQLWFGQISVGSPAVDYTVDFDTGSSDLFLPSVDCDSSCNGHTRYDPSKSSASQGPGQSFSLAYGDGSTVSGNAYTDIVTVAGLAANNQVLGSATQYSTGFKSSNFPPDGLMGLAWPQIAQLGTPFFNTLIQQGSVTSGEFGFKLTQGGAELFLGGINSNLVGGEFTTVPVTTQGFWQVPLDSANVNGTPTVSGIDAIIDSGTTLIVGEKATVDAFYNGIPGSQDASSTVAPGFYTYPCDSNPSVSLSFGGTAFDFTPTFNLGTVSDGSPDCVGGVIALNTGIDNAWIAGDVFMSNFYTAFSFDQSSVSFAPLA